MADTVPQIFNRSSGAVASYDWVDLTTGVGYRRYYWSAYSDGSVKYFLTPRVLDSTSLSGCIYTHIAGAGDSELNADITFLRPATVGTSDCYVQMTTSTGGTTGTYQVILYHVDGSATETSLGSMTTGSLTINNFKRLLFKFTVTLKKFAIGDKLRLCIIFDQTANPGGNLDIFHDGNGLTMDDDTAAPYTRTIDTNLIVDVPFRIDIT